MANHLQQVVDVIAGKHPRYFVMPDGKEAREDFLELATQAEVFDFGKLSLEPRFEEGLGMSWVIPSLTEDEQEMYKLRLITWPAPICWFEFTLINKSFLLIDARNPEYVKIQRVEMDNGLDPMVVFGIWVKVEFSNYLGFTIQTHDNTMARKLKAMTNEKLIRQFGDGSTIAFYLNLMLNSRTTETMKVKVDAKLNKARVKRGVIPLKDHTVVTIVPTRYIQIHSGEGSGDKRRSPRLHWRRSHIRVYENGRKVAIPRFLVGKKETGDHIMSHEYKVQLGT